MTRGRAYALLLAHMLACTDNGIVGFDCPDAGCMSAAPSEPIAAAPPASDAGKDAAVSCNNDLDCVLDDEVFCHPKQKRCVECVEAAHCNAGSDEPFCVNNECRSCANEAACKADSHCDGECENDR